jgi:poly(A) polymerase/tRNA nucleotidyltransferase (CCA-adding enzyme)
MSYFPIARSIREFASRFTEAGFSIYIVGGAVRDFFLHRPVTDYDFATDAEPQEVMGLFRSVVPTGIKHGTVTVLYKGRSHEVTTFRLDGTYGDHRHPDTVHFVRSLDEDLKRRDFTINALAIDASNGTLVDHHQGMEDLKAKTIRAIGDASTRFEEDALRIMRACRFAAQLDFTIEEHTKRSMAEVARRLGAVSGERIRTELMKILESPIPSRGLMELQECNALEVILPELALGDGVGQKGAHLHDVLRHGFAACDAAPRAKPLVRLAALLHDVGKVPAKKIDGDGEATFHKHEIHSEKMARKILGRLKFSNDERSIVLNLIKHHMFHYTQDWTDGAVRRFVGKVGSDALEDLFALRLADQVAIHGYSDPQGIIAFEKRIRQVLEESSALTTRDLDIDGNDLAKLGIPKGPVMGIVLKFLLDTVLDDPKENDHEKLATIAREFYLQRIAGPSGDQDPTSSS